LTSFSPFVLFKCLDKPVSSRNLRREPWNKGSLVKTNHMSSVVAFGGAALWKISQAEADAAIEMAVNEVMRYRPLFPSNQF
jgi:hypothetical protein